jgi:hypothetical protein
LLSGPNVVFALVAVPLVIVIEHLRGAERVKAVIERDLLRHSGVFYRRGI